ncbi:MAG: glutathione ABC transporter substrate-binding protein [Rhodospirillales bacterium]|nr:glutathione ABC transporter substrate-binding protein [Rhodospirillales bacterium]MDE2200204.1 glutathione ABC transporter substrate-binding protein [Rhodospirillales bacterium]MDE2576592.1 glutathione ABC transporter substrate-binding protein [Rhodospirillales bacterium]
MFPRLVLSAAFAAGLAAPALAAKDLVIARDANMPTLDPANTNDNLSISAERSMYQGLYGFDRNMKLVPLLATGYTVNADATEFVFHLRHGVTFHDGTPFNAEAVKVNITRLEDPANHLSRRSLVSMVKQVVVVDPYTVKFELSQPFGAFVNDMAHPGTVMVSPKALATYGKDIGTHPVGTGPFKFASFRTDELKVVRNDHYWKPGLPKVDSITFRSVPENGSRFAMLQTGEAQFIAPMPAELVKVAKANPKLEVVVSPSIVARYVAMNNMKKPFTDLRVREAMNYAVDKKAFVRIVLDGYGDVMDAPIPPNLAFYSKQGAWPYDPAKAKKLLAEAGYPDGFAIELWGANSTQSRRGMEFLQQQFAAIGVKATVAPLEAGLATAKLWGVKTPADATMQMDFTGWSSSTGDADWGLRPLLDTKSFPPNLFNIAYYSSPVTDKDIADGLATADPAKRAAAYAAAQKQIWADAPWIFLSVDQLLAGQSKNLSGVYYLPDGTLQMEEAALN